MAVSLTDKWISEEKDTGEVIHEYAAKYLTDRSGDTVKSQMTICTIPATDVELKLKNYSPYLLYSTDSLADGQEVIINIDATRHTGFIAELALASTNSVYESVYVAKTRILQSSWKNGDTVFNKFVRVGTLGVVNTMAMQILEDNKLKITNLSGPGNTLKVNIYCY